MKACSLITRFTAISTLFVLTGGLAAVGQDSPSDDALIASAMRGGPPGVSRNATVVAMDANGHMRTLRKGSNRFTCMPDNPATPGPDSMCMDADGMRWLSACMSKKAPRAGRVGLIYMLEGGTDASNTDPSLSKPPAGQDWVRTGPHVMVVGADPAFYAAYPSGANPDTSVPYVMWATTPCRHLMAPTT